MVEWEDVRRFVEAALSVFAIVNPVGSLPLLVSLTEGAPPAERRRLVRIAGMVALAIVCTMAVAGDFLLRHVFQVGIHEFTLGGGVLLVVFGIRNILGAVRTDAGATAQDLGERRIGMAVSPIACPMLVGPGTIVTAMLIANQHGWAYALGACLTAFPFVILILSFSHIVYRFLGPVVTLAVGRIMQIFIVAIGTKFIIRGMTELFPVITRP